MRLPVALFVIAITFLLAAPLAAAHVTKQSGAYTVKVGWANEPPITGERNQIIMSVWLTSDHSGVSGLATTLIAKVTQTLDSKQLNMVESDEAPGNYSASIIPTSAGLYAIHVQGFIASTQVSQDFNIEEVQDAGDFAFPKSGSTGTGVSMTDLQNEFQQLRTDVDKLQAEQQKQNNKIPGDGVVGAVLAIAGAATLVAVARRR